MKPNYKKQLDTIFSQYIRLKNSKGGYCVCITCGKRLKIKAIQCGHYISRNHLGTRWEERNCQPQCVGCNVFGGGKSDTFALELIFKYGDNILKELNALKNKIHQFKEYQLREMIDTYKQKIKEIKNGTTESNR